MQLKCSRAQLERRLANIPSCLIGMKTCSGAYYIARQLAALGHDVRLMPAQYVKPFLKGHKNDYRDTEAIAEAVQRPTMHFVAIRHMPKKGYGELMAQDEREREQIRELVDEIDI